MPPCLVNMVDLCVFQTYVILTSCTTYFANEVSEVSAVSSYCCTCSIVLLLYIGQFSCKRLHVTCSFLCHVHLLLWWFMPQLVFSIVKANYSIYLCNLMQVNAAGDLCAICQEKMIVPILLRCKHIFCEDCVSEWLVF